MKFLIISAFLLLNLSIVFAQKSNQGEATKQLYALFDAEWENLMKESPTFASYLGDKRYNDRWEDQSLAAIERRQRHTIETLEKLKKIDRSQLSVSDRLNFDLFQKDYEQSIEGYQFKQFLLPV